MDRVKDMFFYLFVVAVAYYIFPMLIQDTGSGMFILLIAIPILCILVSIVYGIRKSFDIVYILMVMVLFVPSVFIYLNESAFVYVFLYGLVSFLGNFCGYLFAKNIKKIRKR